MAKNVSGNSNADRVRENQRRCRARKREYVASLEERLRRCHEAGVKANVALQEAAQRVVNENRDLRKLLHQQGLSDQDIQTNLSTLRMTVGEALPTSTPSQSESCVAPQSASDSSQTRSEDSFESLLMGALWTETPPGEGYPDQFNAIFTPPRVDSLLDLASEINPSAPSSHSALSTDEYPSPLSDFPPSEMDICCSSFLPSHTAFPSTTSESALSSSNAAGDMSSSTPCTVAYALLTTLNSRRRQQQDMLLITLELLNGFRMAPDGDPAGCRVDNDVLIPVMGKLLAG